MAYGALYSVLLHGELLERIILSFATKIVRVDINSVCIKGRAVGVFKKTHVNLSPWNSPWNVQKSGRKLSQKDRA